MKVTLEKEYDVQAVQLVWEGASAKEYTVTLTAATVWGIKLKEMKVMDIINLPAGIYVAGGRKYIVR